MRKFKVWLRSGANAHDEFEDTVTLEDMGHTEETWAVATRDQKEEALRVEAFAYAEWGWREIKQDSP